MKLSYTQRAEHCTNPTAQTLLRLMDKKQSNLCVAADVRTKEELITLADTVGPYICVLKTHVDIVEDFDEELIIRLQRLSEQHDFLLFEDRKFADIGSTVKHQYQDGIYHIADWADITNAHPLVGPGIVEGLKEVGLHKGRGLLLLAHMSSKDNLISEEYTKKSVDMAEEHNDFVIGFICTKQVSDNPQLIHFTPGVHIDREGDRLGQQYQTPESAISSGTDIIIVGRGITKASHPAETALHYRQEGWDAYTKRLGR